MKTKIYLIAILFFLSTFFSFALGAQEKKSIQADSKETATVEKPLSYYTMEEVKQHADAGECWLVIDDKVYDLTEFVNMHPGGKAILQGCGKDATRLFEERPMGSGTPHSDRARKLLENYLIGYLKTGE
ncbi:cytochrome b5-like heme/steroid binding domain-containing protein [Spirochaetia bacterium 38H-sp]|uniref:Cytochrome b5-like heme/steroid binding domain-containing protein n=1 Tax=Rarispira pelagica TaxID=3141764 RepID=A0ABU9UCC3_9SPIR